jgi:hypothetical protein
MTKCNLPEDVNLHENICLKMSCNLRCVPCSQIYYRVQLNLSRPSLGRLKFINENK